jgi:hypothetical protein
VTSCDVVIVGLPPAAGCASNKTWRAAAESVHARLDQRLGDAVHFEYVDLFGPNMARHPEIETMIADGAELPIVVIDGVARFAGGKLNVSAIERAVAAVIATSIPVLSAIEEPKL